MSEFPEVKDHLVANPDKYTMTTNPDGTVTLRPTWVDNPSEVLQEGTPVNAAFLAKIPEAIDAIDTKVTTQLADKVSQAEALTLLGGISDGTPLFAANTAGMTNTARNYVNTTDGLLYTHNGTAWVSTGVPYQATGISDDSVTPSKTTILKSVDNPNLFDKTKAEIGLVARADGTINKTFTSHYATDFIPVVSGQLYQAPGRQDGAYYDVNKVYVSGFGGTTASLTAPVTGFIRVTIPTSILDTFMFTKSVIPPTYLEYGELIQIKDAAFKKMLDKNTGAYIQTSPIVTRWNAKKVLTIGDSITWYDGKVLSGTSETAVGYQQILKSRLNLSYTNVGVSGQSMAKYPTWSSKSFMNTYTSHDYSQYDLITIALGTNDFGEGDGAVIGSFGNIADTTFDEKTFYGAYRKALDHILTVKPTVKIVLMTPTQRGDGYTPNVVGHTLEDYAEAVIVIGKKYGLPVCDLYHNAGFNKKNISSLTIDGLHPNNLGLKEMGSYLAGLVSII